MSLTVSLPRDLVESLGKLVPDAEIEIGDFVVSTLRKFVEYGGVFNSSQVIRVGGAELNKTTHVVFNGERESKLTPREFAVLLCLMSRAGNPVKHTAIYDEAWRPGYRGLANDLEVCVVKLRRKLSAIFLWRVIVTVKGHGYKFQN
jgi:DNA-binding response OmpR family regulator